MKDPGLKDECCTKPCLVITRSTKYIFGFVLLSDPQPQADFLLLCLRAVHVTPVAPARAAVGEFSDQLQPHRHLGAAPQGRDRCTAARE